MASFFFSLSFLDNSNITHLEESVEFVSEGKIDSPRKSLNIDDPQKTKFNAVYGCNLNEVTASAELGFESEASNFNYAQNLEGLENKSQNSSAAPHSINSSATAV